MPSKIKTAGKGGFSDLSAATRRAVFSFCVLIALFALFAVMSPDKFLAATNLQNLLQQVVTYTIIGCGLSFCLVCGGNDLSAGASMALSGIIVVNLLIAGLPLWLCIILCLIMGILTGVMNGFFIEILGVVPFVATLATQWVYRGMANVLVNGAPVYTTNIPSEEVQSQFYLLGGGRIGGDGLPYSVIITAVYAIILGVVLAKTRIGRQIYACGSNLEAAKLSGINASRPVCSPTASPACPRPSAASWWRPACPAPSPPPATATRWKPSRPRSWAASPSWAARAPSSTPSSAR